MKKGQRMKDFKERGFISKDINIYTRYISA